jgi:hypothetical protein
MKSSDYEIENLHLLEAVKLMIDEQAKRQRQDMDRLRCSVNHLTKEVKELARRGDRHA